MARNREGKKPNVEGRHGDKTHSAFMENIQSKQRTADDATDAELKRRANDGNRRLEEDRQQHDEAEKNSEANRLRR